MLKGNLLDSLNTQVNAELYSSYLYLSMSAYLKDSGLDGFSHWMRVQAQEEMVHGMMIYDYIISRGGRIELAAIDRPVSEWDSPLAAAEGALGHEKNVTLMINSLMDLAIKESDHATVQFLHWFVSEQVEEEANAEELVRNFKLAGKDSSALLMIDRELTARPELYQIPPVKE